MELYVTCLHSGSWILSGAFCIWGLWLGASWPSTLDMIALHMKIGGFKVQGFRVYLGGQRDLVSILTTPIYNPYSITSVILLINLPAKSPGPSKYRHAAVGRKRKASRILVRHLLLLLLLKGMFLRWISLLASYSGHVFFKLMPVHGRNYHTLEKY